MVLSKHGVFFTLSSILFLAVLIILFTSDRRSSSIDTATITVETTSAFQQRLELNYIPLILKHTSYNCLMNLSEDALARGIYLQLPADFNNTMLTRTYRGNTVGGFTTLPEMFDNLSLASQSIGYNVSVSVSTINVTQTSAWTAAYTANVSYNLSSQDGTVKFARNLTMQGSFSLIGLPDLYYNTNSLAKGWSEYLVFQSYEPGLWNNSAFLTFATSRNYTLDNESPSFFNRLQGNTAASPYGVAVTVPMNEASPQNNITSIDVRYFSNTEDFCTFQQPAIYPNLRLNLDQLYIYNITGASVSYNGGSCFVP